MANHPADVVYVDGVAVSKASVRSLIKNNERLTFADANTVRNTHLTGQFGGIYIASLEANFDLDTGSTEADDGLDVIIDLDGFRFVRVGTGSGGGSGGALTQRVITAAGNFTLPADDVDIVIIKKTVGAATQITLPDASQRTKPIRIVDGKYDANTNNITIIPAPTSPAQTIMGGSSYIIDSNGASMILTPLNDGSGWI